MYVASALNMAVTVVLVLILCCCGTLSLPSGDVFSQSNDVATTLVDRVNTLERRASEQASLTLDLTTRLVGHLLQQLEMLNQQLKSNSETPDSGVHLGCSLNISQRMKGVEAELLALRAQNSDRQQGSGIENAQASTFVRWGSASCTGNFSSLVYSGAMGGSMFDHTGAAVNYLCLTLSPVVGQATLPSWGSALLYGAEYETGDSHQDKDPVCAVCRAAFATTVMVPGTDVCPPGWHRQYSGFLMAGLHIHAAGTEFICVDYAMESADKGDANQAPIKALYYTVTRCGTLPCGPYANDKVVTCAVCSK